MKTFLLKTVLTFLLLAGIIGLLVGLFASNIRSMQQAGAMAGRPRVAVASAEISQMEWPVEVQAIGSVSALRGVILSVESPGTIAELSVRSGSRIEQGQVLLQLDDRSERAVLAAAEATAELAQLSLERARQLLARKTIAQAEYDAAHPSTSRRWHRWSASGR